MTLLRIIMMYVKNAVMFPICRLPESINFPPNQITATEERLRIIESEGNITAKVRVTRSCVCIKSREASANRSSSCLVFTKALITRTPAICSRSTKLILSIFTCIMRKAGTIRRKRRIIKSDIIGRTTNNKEESFRFERRAMMMAPMPVIGAPIIIVKPIKRTS